MNREILNNSNIDRKSSIDIDEEIDFKMARVLVE